MAPVFIETPPSGCAVVVLMTRTLLLLLITTVVATGCAPPVPPITELAPPSVAAEAVACGFDSEPWISDWLAAWELTSDNLLQLDRADPPTLFLFDETCIWTTSAVSAPNAPVVDGPDLFGRSLPWRSASHGDTLTLPDATRVPVGLMSYTGTIDGANPFFVMASPGFWERAGITSDVLGHEPFVTGVFLHEFSHARHVEAFTAIFDAIEATWSFEQTFTSDVIERRFGSDSAYSKAFEAEFEALRLAGATDSETEARGHAAEALRARLARQDKFFVGDEAVFREIDDVLTSTEGAAQWAAFAWLTAPSGAALPETVALEGWGTRGGQVRTAGLALFRTVDRLFPPWPELVFSDKMAGATTLLRLTAEKE